MKIIYKDKNILIEIKEIIYLNYFKKQTLILINHNEMDLNLLYENWLSIDEINNKILEMYYGKEEK